MSFITDCPACMAGDHDRHVHDWQIRPGVIGGSTCECRGDCEHRSTRAYEQMMQGATKKEDLDGHSD